ncbi:hypothetical protein L798_14323 [Zootermopsis nevadensis]|uniref:Uncharacterized protein n=1 Tax=Zootermopsis nevadensis TaxID=136037 RepID=A0A067QX13_ZOONE|nr:hypothetical protein L798_14323 [Zootermopsis nevadensis]
MDKGNKKMPKEISMKVANLSFKEQRNRIMKEINAEKKQKLLEERRVLDDLHNRVFQQKRQLCSRVREFSDKYGLLAMMKNPSGFSVQPRRCVQTNEETCIYESMDEEQLKSVVAAMEAELSVADAKLEESRLHLASLQEEHLHLLHSPTGGHKLQELHDLKQQTELLESQCEALQQELGWQNLIMKQGTNIDNTEQKADNIEQVFETTDITCMVPAKVTRTSENSGVEHKQGILPLEPSKSNCRPFVPKIPSKMSLKMTLHRSHDLEKQLCELLSSAKSSPKPGKS